MPNPRPDLCLPACCPAGRPSAGPGGLPARGQRGQEPWRGRGGAGGRTIPAGCATVGRCPARPSHARPNSQPAVAPSLSGRPSPGPTSTPGCTRCWPGYGPPSRSPGCRCSADGSSPAGNWPCACCGTVPPSPSMTRGSPPPGWSGRAWPAPGAIQPWFQPPRDPLAAGWLRDRRSGPPGGWAGPGRCRRPAAGPGRAAGGRGDGPGARTGRGGSRHPARLVQRDRGRGVGSGRRPGTPW